LLCIHSFSNSGVFNIAQQENDVIKINEMKPLRFSNMRANFDSRWEKRESTYRS